MHVQVSSRHVATLEGASHLTQTQWDAVAAVKDVKHVMVAVKDAMNA